MRGNFDHFHSPLPLKLNCSIFFCRSAQVEFAVEVQMFQLYRDGLEDLLKEKTERKKKKKGEEEDDMKEKPTGLKITLAGKDTRI